MACAAEKCTDHAIKFRIICHENRFPAQPCRSFASHGNGLHHAQRRDFSRTRILLSLPQSSQSISASQNAAPPRQARCCYPSQIKCISKQLQNRTKKIGAMLRFFYILTSSQILTRAERILSEIFGVISSCTLAMRNGKAFASSKKYA